ncbi:hypothetical protein [Hymenobacter jeollabukensis]|uniref:HEAT repeat domain-containing protein n=1 Tax=Hymenobacter jeollabukensis TaxID=2025313 RepID=A0A5R8WR10_9BACT|nr:hypothetical protein [Hymenobacter jeollabukensis]TLM92380.1 hypothetical protein FDY95_13190 [Hymenobacter jeollabukensis]
MPDTPPPASPALARFRTTFFGDIDHYLAWHDGYEADTTTLDALTPAGRAAAERELLAALQAHWTDPRVIIGLGHLRSRAALPLLHDHLPNAGAYVLAALAQIDAAAVDWPRIDALLGSGASPYQLLDMLMGLRQYFSLAQLPPDVPVTVLSLLIHPEYLVRYHALAALRTWYHLPSAASSQPRADHIFGLICSDQSAGQHREAQRLIREQMQARGYAG